MRLFLTLILLGLVSLLYCQTPISGKINSYQAVQALDSANQSVKVNNASAYSPGDMVLLIQMQGAVIDESLSDNFGTIQNYHGAGAFEVHRICQVQGTQISFHQSIKENFDVNGAIQLIRIPEYSQGAQLSGDITGDSWNGSSGGVIAIKVNGTLNLNGQSIDASGLGFRGGEALPSGGGCLPVSLSIQYTDKNSTNDRALKGEGIAQYISGKECSRGPQANGGGGGNNHNGGGSGGSNYGVGGAGGQRVKYSSLACGSVIGLDSKSLVSGYGSGRIFLGGGGGAGHGNNAGLTGESGQNGGGIVFIISDSIISNNGKILANGYDATQNAESEGAGGGGAGGTIILHVPPSQITGNLNLQAIGGAGGGVENVGNQNCSGPGGGGGGGYIGHSTGSLATSVSALVNGGVSGTTVVATQSGCSVGSTNGAKAGTAGIVNTFISLPIYTDTLSQISQSDTACNEYMSPSGKFVWTTSGNFTDTAIGVSGCLAVYNIQLTVEQLDTTVTLNSGSLSSNASGVSYQWIDCATLNSIQGETAKIFVPPYNGEFAVVISNAHCSDTSACYPIENVSVNALNLNHQVKVYPNPSTGDFSIEMLHTNPWSYQVTTLDGKVVMEAKNTIDNLAFVSLDKPGYYILRIESNGSYLQKPIVIQP